jgi:hypothetical protein
VALASQPQSLTLLPDRLTVCRLDPSDPVPEWAAGEGFLSITRTATELSIVCDEQLPPDGLKKEDGWRALVIDGQLDFGLVGIVAELSGILAAIGISLFVIATFDTDYLLVKADVLERAVAALRKHGNRVVASD